MRFATIQKVIGFLIIGSSLVSCSPDVGYTAVEELVFDDAVFRDCVVSEAKKNGWVNAGQILDVHCVNPTSRKISNLSGIENLHNIRALDLAHNEISDMSPLAALNELEHLNLDDNHIRQVPGGISHSTTTTSHTAPPSRCCPW